MKRAARFIATSLLATTTTITMAGAVSAAEYNLLPPGMSLIGCSDIVTGVNVQITDLKPTTTATINWAQVPASTSSGTENAVVDSAGTAKTTFIPSVAGNYQVDAVGTDAAGEPWTGSLPVTVLTTCTTGGVVGGEEDVVTVPVADTETEAVVGGLADTGAGNTGLLLALSAGALLVGGTTVIVARSRARGKADAA